MSDWIAVASAEHVAIGRKLGFMQVCHGNGAPLKRLRAGDRIAYYSPVRVFGGTDFCQAFTAIGTVCDERIYQGVNGAPGLAGTRSHRPSGCGPASGGPALDPRQGGGFQPFRRDVDWFDAREAPIHPLADRLSFMQGKTNWGYAFRFGLLKVSPDDMDVIERAMRARSLAHA
ncbi:MAG: EVE domain-containing protein [Pseudomonadota bacterium]